MTKEEQALQNALINTYTYNLKFLSEYDNPLFQRVQLLSDAIGKGFYQERYFLEFVKDNGEFDIFDSHTNTYIYDKKPKQWNSKAINKTNLDLDNTISLLSRTIYEKNITDISQETMDLYKLSNLKVMSDIRNYQNIHYEHLDNKTRKVKKFNKFIFVGTLLARHIPKIIQKLGTKNHFVCEANLEIFRLSLFVCDYSIMARDGKTVVFSIMEDEHIFLEKFNLFFVNEILENVVYKYYSTNYNLENYFDRILNVILNKDPMLFNYRLLLDSMIKQYVKNFNRYKTFNFGQINQSSNIFQDKDVLYIGAGPSLGKNIQWLKENQHKFIIVTMAAALKKLAQFDIKPDIITSLDPQDGIVLKQFNGGDVESVQNAIKILALNTPQKVFNLFDTHTDLVYTFESLKSFQSNNIPLDGLSIGEVTFKILLLLNPKNLYLLGIDLAFDQKTGRTHIDTHGSYENNQFKIDYDKQDNQSMLNNTFSLRDDSIFVKGNHMEKVMTSRLFYVSLADYNQAVKLYKNKNTTIYNLSENGAFIEQTIPTHISELFLRDITIDKDILQKDLLEKFDAISSVFLNDFDKSLIIFQIEQIDHISQKIALLRTFKMKTFDEFKKQTTIISNLLLDMNSHNTYMTELYLNFSFIIERYIDFAFNGKDLKDESQKIKELQHTWSYHLDKIIKTYKNYLQELIQ